MRVRGFAELSFEESAGLSFARAVERAATDPSQDFPGAWVIDERRISFSLDADLVPSQLHAHRRILEELAREARQGEARLDVEGTTGRWEISVGIARSTAPRADTSDVVGGPEAEEHPTIRTHRRA